MDDWAKRNNVVIMKPLAYNAQANVASEHFWRHLNSRMMATIDYPGAVSTDARITFQWNLQRKRRDRLLAVRAGVRRASSHARPEPRAGSSHTSPTDHRGTRRTITMPTDDGRNHHCYCRQSGQRCTAGVGSRAQPRRRGGAAWFVAWRQVHVFQPASGRLPKARGAAGRSYLRSPGRQRSRH